MNSRKHPPALICITLSILSIVLLAGCSGPPSESMGRRLLQHRIESQSNGKISLADFTKTNGKGDNSFYVIEFEADIEFLADGSWVRGSSLDPAIRFEFSTQQIGNNPMLQLLNGVTGATNVRQGEHTKITGTLRFEKTDKGWRGEDGAIY